MRRHYIGLALTVSFLVGGAGPADPVKQDLAKLEGKWVIVSYEKDGVKLDAEEVKELPSLTIKGKEYTWSNGERPGSFTLDPTKKPKTIDYTITAGDDKGTVELAIYEITGDTWRDCFAPAGKPRPSEFAAPEGSGNTLIVYKRVK